MDEFAPTHGAALSRSRPVSCPPSCTESPHDDLDPPGTVLHRSPPATVTVYDEAWELVAAHVRAVSSDKALGWICTDPARLGTRSRRGQHPRWRRKRAPVLHTRTGPQLRRHPRVRR